MTGVVQDGQFYGKVAGSRRLGDFVLAETRYPGRAVVPWHSHESPLVCFVFRGALEERTETGSRQYRSGAVFYHPMREPHSHRFAPAGAQCFTLTMRAEMFRRLEPRDRVELQAPLDASTSPIAWLVRRLHAEFQHGAAASELVLEGLALAVLGELTRWPGPGSRNGRPVWVETVRDRAEAHCDKSVSLTSLAAEVGIHPVHLARSFRRAFGCSLGEYARRARIERARQALLATDQSLASIALMAGFSDQAHFCRQFKLAIGTTPGAYRAAGRQTRD
jgi:AraC family transcriptional regulator